MATKKICNRADELTYHALQKAIENDKLRIYLDYSRINRPLSPVYNPWESLLPILIPVLIGLVLIVGVGVIFGLLFIIGMIFIYANLIKKRLHQKLIRRTKDYLVSNFENCCHLWNFGGIVLVNSDNKNSGCVAPEGNWKEFVVRNFADMMLEPENTAPLEEEKPHEKTESRSKTA